MIEWRPASEAFRQENYLVTNEDMRGWFAIAGMNALGEWWLDGTQMKPPYEVTHFCTLNHLPLNS